MKASKLLKIIQEDLKKYPINYLKNKVTDERYIDPLIKKLAEYNSNIYYEIYEFEIEDDYEISNDVVKNIRNDIGYYFDKYAPTEFDEKKLTTNLTLYLALIAKKPLHPFSEDKNDDVFFFNGTYYCKGKIKYIKDYRSLCRYCSCKTLGYQGMF